MSRKRVTSVTLLLLQLLPLPAALGVDQYVPPVARDSIPAEWGPLWQPHLPAHEQHPSLLFDAADRTRMLERTKTPPTDYWWKGFCGSASRCQPALRWWLLDDEGAARQARDDLMTNPIWRESTHGYLEPSSHRFADYILAYDVLASWPGLTAQDHAAIRARIAAEADHYYGVMDGVPGGCNYGNQRTLAASALGLAALALCEYKDGPLGPAAWLTRALYQRKQFPISDYNDRRQRLIYAQGKRSGVIRRDAWQHAAARALFRKTHEVLFMRQTAFVFIALALLSTAAKAAESLIESPDKAVRGAPGLSADGAITYRVDFKGKPVILTSKLGFIATNNADLTTGFTQTGSTRGEKNETWKPVCGQRAQIIDAYRSLDLAFENKAYGNLKMALECRAYNAGFAFRYVFPKQARAQLGIAKETTEFVFTGDHRAWPVYAAQGTYKPALLSEVKDGAERPLTVETADGPVVALGEAGLFTFARMKFAPLAGKPHALVSRLDGPAELTLPGATPWRYVMAADNAARLLEQSDLVLNLNEPSKIADTSWIKPGKVIRETSLTTTGGKACVDFAKVMNLQYVEFDAGWYGHEYNDASDARAVNLDPKRSKGPLDLQEVIRYGKEKGVGVLLYVNRREVERRLDELLPIYKSWGVAGIKYGFVTVGNQKWTTWLHDAIRKAGEAGMMIDIHDEYRLTGNQRTWPNVMTVEGISGNEEMPGALHNCALPFTRYLCGPADYTPCWYNNRVKNTRAHQLALAAVYYSPWQFLFWYDSPGLYKADPELDFWRQIPTVWDDTRVLNARIGAYATIARRTGNDWFVGSINALERRTLNVPLTFLLTGKRYAAQIYSDGAPDGTNRTRVTCSTREVTSADTITADMADNGGHAIRLVPIK